MEELLGLVSAWVLTQLVLIFGRAEQGKGAKLPVEEATLIGAIVGGVTAAIGTFIFYPLTGVAKVDPGFLLCGVPGLFCGLIGGKIGRKILGRELSGAVVGGVVGGVISIVLCGLLIVWAVGYVA